jgi:hypothetical protein
MATYAREEPKRHSTGGSKNAVTALATDAARYYQPLLVLLISIVLAVLATRFLPGSLGVAFRQFLTFAF